MMKAEIDHVAPLAVCCALGNKLAILKLLPERLIMGKGSADPGERKS